MLIFRSMKIFIHAKQYIVTFYYLPAAAPHMPAAAPTTTGTWERALTTMA